MRMSRMFVRVQKSSGVPILGGFIILKDHAPKGWYREVVFKGLTDTDTAVLDAEIIALNATIAARDATIATLTRPFTPVVMTVTGTKSGATTVTITFKDGTNKIVSIATYDPAGTTASYVSSLTTDMPGIGTFSVNAGNGATITVTNPVSKTLVGTIAYT